MTWTNKLLPRGVLCPCHSKSMQYFDTCQAMEILNLTNGKHLSESSTLIYTSRKPVRCTGKLLKIRSKLILIHFISLVDYVLFSFL
jgi:hypothetical protein